MKIMLKSGLLFLGTVLVMTGLVLAAGTIILDDLIYRFQERVLRLELATAGQAIEQKLNLSGVRAAAQAAAELQAQLQAREGLHTVRLAIVEAPDNRVVFHPEWRQGDRAAFAFIDAMFRDQDGSIQYDDRQGSHFAVFTTLLPIGWLLSLSLDQGEMMEKKYDFLRAIGGITFFVLCLNAAILGLFGRRLARRLGQVLDCVKRIENGELSARIHGVPSADEIGQLQSGIDAMSAGIEQRTRERLAAEQALSVSRELLQSIIDNSAAVIFVKDPDGRYLLVNRRFAELFHVDREALVGCTDYDVFPAAIADAFGAADRQAAAAGGPVQFEEEVPQEDGVHTYFTQKFPLRDAAGRQYAVCGIATDITERKQMEAERQARLSAEAASRAKSTFLATMTHELRTPLNAILGYAQMLRRDAVLPASQAKGLAIIQQSGQHLLTLINDILDLAKVEAGKIEIRPEPVNFRAFLQGVLDIVMVRVEEKGLAFVHDFPIDLPDALRVDEKRLRQVLLNLLSNAVKFTDRGQIEFKVEVLAADAELVRLRFTVADSGVGIERGQLEAIFEPFEQLGEAGRRAVGTGLGLAISRQLVRLMGSDIEVESMPGRGSRFWFDLALPPAWLPAQAPGLAGDGPAPAPAPTVVPGREDLEILHRLALAGDMRNIRRWAEELAARDAIYRPFAERLLRLAGDYRSKAIRILVEEQLRGAPAGPTRDPDSL